MQLQVASAPPGHHTPSSVWLCDATLRRKSTVPQHKTAKWRNDPATKNEELPISLMWPISAVEAATSRRGDSPPETPNLRSRPRGLLGASPTIAGAPAPPRRETGRVGTRRGRCTTKEPHQNDGGFCCCVARSLPGGKQPQTWRHTHHHAAQYDASRGTVAAVAAMTTAAVLAAAAARRVI